MDVVLAPMSEMRDAEPRARHQHDRMGANNCSWGRTGHGYPPLIHDID